MNIKILSDRIFGDAMHLHRGILRTPPPQVLTFNVATTTEDLESVTMNHIAFLEAVVRQPFPEIKRLLEKDAATNDSGKIPRIKAVQ